MKRFIAFLGLLVLGFVGLQSLADAQEKPKRELQQEERRRAMPRLMRADREAAFRKMLRAVEDEEIQQKINDCMLYTNVEVPRTVQHHNAAVNGVFATTWMRGQNGFEFPWDTPFGMNGVSNIKTFRGVWLPVNQATGQHYPIAYWQETLPRYAGFQGESRGPGMRAVHPLDATYFEFMTLRDPQGHDWLFEIRVRTREDTEWAVDVFRPIENWQDLVEEVKKVEDWEKYPKLVNCVNVLTNRPAFRRGRIADTNHPTSRRVIDQSGWLEDVPELPTWFVKRILNKNEWVSCLGGYWRDLGDRAEQDVFAASTRSQFSFVPTNYHGGLIEIERNSCARCHDTTNRDVVFFDAGREWYGNTPGVDGQFTFSWAVSRRDGFSHTLRVQDFYSRNGLVERFSRARHPRTRYRQLADGVH